MRMCMDHWNKLRDAIRERGLYSLVADSGEKAASNLVNEVKDGTSIDNFDPLMRAHNGILAKCMEMAGPYLLEMMQPKEDGTEHCPLCWHQAKHEELCTEEGCTYSHDQAIPWAADGVLADWKELTA